MTDPSERGLPQQQRTRAPLRLVDAVSLFDGHDASSTIVRRMLQNT